MNNTVLLSSAYLAPVQYYVKLLQYPHALVEQYDHYMKQTYRNRCVIATQAGVQALTVPVELESKSKTLMRDVRISPHGAWQHLHWQSLVSAYENSPFFEYYADDFRPFYERRYDFLLDFNDALCATVCTLLDLDATPTRTTEYHPAATSSATATPSIATAATPDALTTLSVTSAVPPATSAALPTTPAALPATPAALPATSATLPATHAAENTASATRECPSVALSCADDFRDAIHPKRPWQTDAAFAPQPYYQVFAARNGFRPNLSIVDLLFNEGPAALITLRNSIAPTTSCLTL